MEFENSRKLKKTSESTPLIIILEFAGYVKILVPRATPAIGHDSYAESYSRRDVLRATGLMCRELAPKSYFPFFACSATSHGVFPTRERLYIDHKYTTRIAMHD
jgi:hypothetical protein